MQSPPETYQVAASLKPTGPRKPKATKTEWAASLFVCLLSVCFVMWLWIGDDAAPLAQLPSAQSRLDDYSMRIEVLGLSPLVENYEVSGTTITVAVADGWHYQPYQMRLQAAQKLWRIWADVNIPLAPEDSAIRITDASGNEVGGSSILYGVWVQE